MPNIIPIKPLFKKIQDVTTMGNITITLADDNYNKNKKDKIIFIDAKNDAQAIAAFLTEYKDSP